MTRPAPRPVDAPCCEGPGYDGQKCGRPSRYFREVDGKEVPLCDAHNMQIHRAWKAGKDAVIYPLQVRKVVRKVHACEGPGEGRKRCAAPGWNLGPEGQRLCDAHKKQLQRRGLMWPIGQEAP